MKAPAHQSAFLGRGWAFPPAFDDLTGGAVMVAGDADIRQSIELLLRIAPGERQMLPPYGCDLRPYLFAPLDSTMRTMIETELRLALLNYEPRIDVETIEVEPTAPEGPQGILITIAYAVRGANRRYNQVFPYYLDEATGLPG